MVADIGGSTVDEATRRVMAFLLDHSLSREYNFVGRHGKREFRVSNPLRSYMVCLLL